MIKIFLLRLLQRPTLDGGVLDTFGITIMALEGLHYAFFNFPDMLVIEFTKLVRSWPLNQFKGLIDAVASTPDFVPLALLFIELLVITIFEMFRQVGVFRSDSVLFLGFDRGSRFASAQSRVLLQIEPSYSWGKLLWISF